MTETVWLFVDDDDTRGITFTPAARTIREGATGTYEREAEHRAHGGRDRGYQLRQRGRDGEQEQPDLHYGQLRHEPAGSPSPPARTPTPADGTANLTHRPSGGDYSAGEAKDFMVTVTDDDTAGLVLSATTLGVDEAGQNTYTVKLQTQPTTTVTVTVSSDDTGAATATVSGSTLIFTASNWRRSRRSPSRASMTTTSRASPSRPRR